MANVYVVEDDSNIREIEMFALKNSGYSVEGFENARTFFHRLTDKKPDLVLLDIMLPDVDGMDILKRIRTSPETKKIPVIMVTAKTTEIDKVKGLDLGADDYITKPFGVMELISRVKALLRRTMNLEDDKIITNGVITMDTEKRSVYAGDNSVELTYKEFELLKLLLKNAGIVLRREIIMERVWGADFEGESRTLDMHIKTLRQKLGEYGSMIKTVRNVGYQVE
ncbi:MAG: response regulator transcription factor [Butyrivibrio sp.]